MCRRPHVGLGDLRIPDSCRRYHPADALAFEQAIAKTHASRAGQSGRSVAEWSRSGGALNVATKPILNH